MGGMPGGYWSSMSPLLFTCDNHKFDQVNMHFKGKQEINHFYIVYFFSLYSVYICLEKKIWRIVQFWQSLAPYHTIPHRIITMLRIF